MNNARAAARCWVFVTATALLISLLAGCSTITHKQAVGATDEGHDKTTRQIAIFLDGTHNDEASDTNVKRLHSLVSLQQRQDLFTLYVEGVGTGADVSGMAAGYGFGERVRLAYAFLLKHYRPGDNIYLFGFSRGAYAARVLNSMLYHAGLPPKPDHLTHAEWANAVFSFVKVESDYPAQYEPLRRQRVQDQLRADHHLPASPSVPVLVLGLWDTVEALGMVDYRSRLRHKAQIEQHLVNIDIGNARYGDKLCNVHYAFHALSIDDDREWIFTPLLLTRKHLFAGCAHGDIIPMLDSQGKLRPEQLREVWFAGAHSDVGGGYADSQMSGVALNWMIQQLEKPEIGLLLKGTRVPEDAYGTSHDPEARAWSPLYHAISRDLVGYVRSDASLTDRLCVHESVFQRRRFVPVKSHENRQLRLQHEGMACLMAARPEINSLDARGRFMEVVAEPDGRCPEGTATTIEVRQYPHC